MVGSYPGFPRLIFSGGPASHPETLRPFSTARTLGDTPKTPLPAQSCLSRAYPGEVLGPQPVADHVALVQSAELIADIVDDLLNIGSGDTGLAQRASRVLAAELGVEPERPRSLHPELRDPEERCPRPGFSRTFHVARRSATSVPVRGSKRNQVEPGSGATPSSTNAEEAGMSASVTASNAARPSSGVRATTSVADASAFFPRL